MTLHEWIVLGVFLPAMAFGFLYSLVDWVRCFFRLGRMTAQFNPWRGRFRPRGG